MKAGMVSIFTFQTSLVTRVGLTRVALTHLPQKNILSHVSIFSLEFLWTTAWWWHKYQKLAYLTTKNSSFASFCMTCAIFLFVHFVVVLVVSTTWNDLFYRYTITFQKTAPGLIFFKRSFRGVYFGGAYIRWEICVGRSIGFAYS